MTSLETTNRKIVRCRRCPSLNVPKKTMSAPGHGHSNANLMVIGQSLHGYNPATTTQIPFVGPVSHMDSGSWYRKALKHADMVMQEVFTTNVVHCHPPKNRPSTPEEVHNCHQWLLKEVELVDPEHILVFGATARRNLVYMGWQFSKHQLTPVGEYPYPTKSWVYHPAWVMRLCDPYLQKKWVTEVGDFLHEHG